MNYKEYIKNQLEPHPFGKDMDAIARRLPEDGEYEELESALEELARRGSIKQFGNKWRWMKFN